MDKNALPSLPQDPERPAGSLPSSLRVFTREELESISITSPLLLVDSRQVLDLTPQTLIATEHRGQEDPEPPLVVRLALGRFKHEGARFVGLGKGGGPAFLHNGPIEGLEKRSQTAQAVGDRSLGQGKTQKSPVGKKAGRGAMEGEFVDEDPDPNRDPELAPGNESRSGRGQNGTSCVGTGTGLPVAGPPDDPPVRPHLDLEDLGGLGRPSGGKGPETARTAFSAGGKVMNLDDGREGRMDRPSGTFSSGLVALGSGWPGLFRGEGRIKGSRLSLFGLPTEDLLLQSPDLGLERGDLFQESPVGLSGLLLGPAPPHGRRTGFRRMGRVTTAGGIGVLGAGQAGVGRNNRDIRNALRCLKVGKDQKFKRAHASCLTHPDLRVQPQGKGQ